MWLVADRGHEMWYRWAFCLLLGLTVPHFRSIGSVAVVGPAKVVAKYSYGIYMGHTIAMVGAFRMIPVLGTGWRWAMMLTLAVIGPVLMFHLIEQPMIRVGQRIAGRISGAESRSGRAREAEAGAAAAASLVGAP